MTQDIIGRTLLERFRVDAYVASGGMGTVFRVWDLQRNVPVAMKVLHGDLAEDPSVFRRFKREARALEKLAHPNIVPFYGLYQTLDYAFLLERYIDGLTLKQILRRREGEPLPVEEALTYIKTISSALGYAHTHGVVHCDVKPGNVMVDQSGVIYLTDFGVARHAESTTTTLGFAGTAAYMAPEQIRGEAVTAATDVYALGVMLYEMLTGGRLFRGNEAGTEKGGSTASERVRYAHIHLPPQDPREFNEEIPDALAEVILKALEKRPVDRFPNAHALFEAARDAVEVSPESVSDRIAIDNVFRDRPVGSPLEVIEENQIQASDGIIIAGRHYPVWHVVLAMGAVIGLVALILSLAGGSKGRSFSVEAEQAESIVIVVTATKDHGASMKASSIDEGNISTPTATRVEPTATPIPPSPIPPTATATVTPTTKPLTQREQKIIADVRDYWSLVDQNRYEEAWDYLTPHFKKKYVNDSYDYYVEEWQYTDSIEIVDVKVLDVENFKATADVWLIFTADTVVLEKHIRLQLVYSEYLKIWEIYESTYM